jgi:hypothetical protein
LALSLRADDQEHQTHREKIPQPNQLLGTNPLEKCRPDGGMNSFHRVGIHREPRRANKAEQVGELMNLRTTTSQRFGKAWKLPLIGVVAGALILGTTAGAATAAPAVAKSTTQQAKASLSQLGLYKAPATTSSEAKSAAKPSTSKGAFVDSSQGLVIPGKDAGATVSVKPAGNLSPTSTEAGLSVYEGNGYSYALTSESAGANAGYSIINSANAPSTYSYEVAANGKPAELVLTPNGSVGVKDSNGVLINQIAPAWAKDANGKIVKTSYSVNGNILTQTVNHQGSAYPVVADPQLVCNWGICDIKFNKSETAIFAGGGWAYVLGVCALGGPPLIAACGVQAGWWIVVAQQARNEGKCVALHNIPAYPYVYQDGDCT